MKMVRIAGKRPFYTNGQHFDCLIALVPLIGERWAELAEMPVMAAVIFIAAGYMLRHFPEVAPPGLSLAAGLLALAFFIVAELGLAVLLQDQTLAEFIGSRDKIRGTAS